MGISNTTLLQIWSLNSHTRLTAHTSIEQNSSKSGHSTLRYNSHPRLTARAYEY